MTVLEFAWCRTVCNLVVAVAVLLQKKISPFEGITRDMWIPLGLRCVLGNIGFVSLTYSFKHLPLSVGTVIIATSPFAVAVMASIFLNEKIQQNDVNAILVSFAGIVIMAFSKSENVYKETTTSQYVFALLICVFTMIVVATVAICARFMKKLNFAVIQVNNAIFGVVFVGTLLMFETKPGDRAAYGFGENSTFGWIILAGMINSVGQNLMVITMQHSNPAAVSLYRYFGVFYGFFWDIAVFRRAFDFLQVAGLSIVFVANVGSLLLKMQAERMEALVSPEDDEKSKQYELINVKQ